jgi:hypothetical protein
MNNPPKSISGDILSLSAALYFCLISTIKITLFLRQFLHDYESNKLSFAKGPHEMDSSFWLSYIYSFQMFLLSFIYFKSEPWLRQIQDIVGANTHRVP